LQGFKAAQLMSCISEYLTIDHGGPVDRPFEPFPASALERSIVDRFDAIARRFASRLAVRDCVRQLTYAELSALAGRVAAAIAPVVEDRPGPVAILLARDVYFPAAMLGVLACGRGYVPLDPSNPIARNQLIATQSGAAAVVSAGDLAGNVRALFPNELPVIDVATVGDGGTLRPDLRPGPEDVAFIVYTSGSTGRPKGVYHSHRNLLHDVMQQTDTMHLNPHDRVGMLHSPSIIGGSREIFMSLLNGASLHLLSPQDLQAAGLVREIRSQRITYCRLVPTLLLQIAEALGPGQRLDSVRIVALGSQRIDWSDFDVFRRHFSAEAFLLVGIGATECGGNFAHWFVDERVRQPNSRLPVGRVLPDARLTIVGDDGCPVAAGDVGEMVVESRYLALGYWRNPDMTASRFMTDPADSGKKALKTGDLGRLRPDGLIEFVGRNDEQIKLRGHRIETGEIEMALREIAGVQDASIVVRRNEAGDPRSLVAYIELRPGIQGLSSREARSKLRAHLPQYMVPAAVTVLDALPRLPNLKIDRTRLAEIHAAHRARGADQLDDPLVVQMIKIFETVIGTTNATPDDNAASLGGDSLQSIIVAVELEKHFRITIPVEIFEGVQTIRDLAAWIATNKAQRNFRSTRD
jgi:amino acid adenylation domain-containing protein